MLSIFGATSILGFLLSMTTFRIERYAKYLSFITFLWISLEVLAQRFLGVSVFKLNMHGSIGTFFVFESFLFWLAIERTKTGASIIPYYVKPLLNILIFYLSLNFLTIENSILLISFGILYQTILRADAKHWTYLFKNLLVCITIIIFLVLAYHIEGKELTLPLVIFLYWFTSDLLPLGLEESNEDTIIQPVANRLVLLAVLRSKTIINLPLSTIFTAITIIGFLGALSIFLSRSKNSIWKNYRRSLEVTLILLFFSQHNKLSEEFTTALIGFSLYTFLPYVSFIKSKSYFSRFLLSLGALLLSGAIFGSLYKVLSEGLVYSKLEGIGPLYFYLLVPFSIINLTYWLKVFKFKENESKIDHLSYFSLASAIIMSVIISF